MSNKCHPKVGFRSADSLVLLFQSLSEMTAKPTIERILKPLIQQSLNRYQVGQTAEINRLVEPISQRFQNVHYLSNKIDSMAEKRRVPDDGVKREVGTIAKINKNNINRQYPPYYGEVEFEDGEKWQFVTNEGDNLRQGFDYLLTYEFTSETVTEVSVKIRDYDQV